MKTTTLDDGRIIVSLKDVIEDYHYGCRTLIDGRETALPEDVGGLWRFFLDAIFAFILRTIKHFGTICRIIYLCYRQTVKVRGWLL
jgi:hypothetical protein